ncbi:MAG: hypothetical protein IKC57_02040 [Alistipes sp.]|nr:hypothetical protein [Alistipes sp.]
MKSRNLRHIPKGKYFPFNQTIEVQQMLPFHGKILLSKVVRCGASQKKTPRDSTKTYSPRGLTFWDVPQIAAFHDKITKLSHKITILHLPDFAQKLGAVDKQSQYTKIMREIMHICNNNSHLC